MGARDSSKEAVMGLHDVCLSSHPLGGSRPSLSLMGGYHCPHSQPPWDSCHTGDLEREGGGKSPAEGGDNPREEGRGQPGVQLQEGQR